MFSDPLPAKSVAALPSVDGRTVEPLRDRFRGSRRVVRNPGGTYSDIGLEARGAWRTETLTLNKAWKICGARSFVERSAPLLKPLSDLFSYQEYIQLQFTFIYPKIHRCD